MEKRNQWKDFKKMAENKGNSISIREWEWLF